MPGREKACRVCKRITQKSVCDNCGSSNLATSYIGLIIILDPERSEIAKELGFRKSGSYAIKTA